MKHDLTLDERIRVDRLVRDRADVLEQNAATFKWLVGRAGAARAHGRAFWTQVAAHFGWMNHPGVLASPQLEQSLAKVSSTVPSPPHRPTKRGLVVHVLTQAQWSGGHTRLAWRWIEADRRPASVVLTEQGWQPIPTPLLAATGAAGGVVVDLGARPGSLIERARRLRVALASADIIVLHVHPFEVVALLALAEWPDRPPVVFMNHADHVFWLGSTTSDAVAHFRQTGATTSRAYRGIAESRSAMLPLPVVVPESTNRRQTVRARLGVADEDVLVLSAAAPYKFEPLGGLDYLEVAFAAVRAHPRLRVIIVGPDSDGRWRRASDACDGRIRAVGRRPDLPDYFAAADIYLDSMPVASITSLLEAGLHGLPLVAPAPTPGVEILSSDAPGLDDVLMRGATMADLVSLLVDLAGDAGQRRQIGRRSRDAIAAVSQGDAWGRALGHVYDVARVQRSPAAGRPSAEPLHSETDILATGLAALRDDGQGLGAAIVAHVRSAPLAARIRTFGATVRSDPSGSTLGLVPDWGRTMARRARG